jgi:low temperature requirement protein LtrA
VTRAAAPRAVAERGVRVSTLELFFDLVFVFTITQLAGVLVDGEGLAALAQVVVMLLLIWWMYDGYAWLTNAIATDRLRFRLLLIGGMGGFLVIALAIPDAYDGDGLAFGVGYLAVVLLHAGMFVRGATVSEVRAILRIAPFNLLAVVLVLVGGAAGGDTQWTMWALTGALLWVTPRIATVEGFVVSVSHFVERHGLVVIVALGESIVVIGAGAAGLPPRPGARPRPASRLAFSVRRRIWALAMRRSVGGARGRAPPGSGRDGDCGEGGKHGPDHE